MPSIEEGIASLKSLSDAKELEDKLLRLKMLLEEGIITQDEADQRFIDFKRSKGMALGGEILSMANGGGVSNLINSLSELMRGLVFVESRGNPNAVSEAGAIGLTQVKVPTAMQPGYNVDTIFDIARKNGVDFSGETAEEARRLLFIPSLNVQFGEQYLQAMIKRFGNVRDGITAYNQGPKTMTEFIESGRDPNILSKEGRDYLPKVLQAIGVKDFGFESIPPVASKDERPLGGFLPQSFDFAGLNFIKSEDPISPRFEPLPPTRPTELTEELGLPGDVLRDAEVELKMAKDPNLVGFSKEPMTRSFAIEEEEKDPILASSSLPLQRPSGIN